jgi:hypothetical protein
MIIALIYQMMTTVDRPTATMARLLPGHRAIRR